jgi:hypothetical protein
MASSGVPEAPRRKTNSARRVFCRIARASVQVTLRHGHGLQEPGRLYVRCEERECQYVDINEPPCPLHIDMFREHSDDLVRDYLTAFAGVAVCYGCLSETLHLRHAQVRYAVWRLTERPGWRVDVKAVRCARCRRRRSTIRLTLLADAVPARPDASRDVAPSPRAAWRAFQPADARGDDEADVVEVLLRAPDLAFCGSCLAFTTSRTLCDARRIVETLQRDERFTYAHAQCATCGRIQDIIGAADSDGSSTPRAG